MKYTGIVVMLFLLEDSDPDNFETSPVMKELNGRMPGQQDCEDIWDEFAFPGFGENFIIPEIHVCFGGPDDGVCHVSYDTISKKGTLMYFLELVDEP